MGDEGQILQPPAPTLANRLWLSALSSVGAEYAAQHGVGLMLSRAAWGHDEPTDNVQLPVANSYLNAWNQSHVKPRVGLSRGFYIAADKQSALKELRKDLLHAATGMSKQGRLPANLSLEEYCLRFHISYGHPDEVAAHLLADKILPFTSDLILQLDPIFPSLERTLQMFEQIATRVAPILGWRPE